VVAEKEAAIKQLQNLRLGVSDALKQADLKTGARSPPTTAFPPTTLLTPKKTMGKRDQVDKLHSILKEGPSKEEELARLCCLLWPNNKIKVFVVWPKKITRSRQRQLVTIHQNSL
jgi:hypothetical protein